jgi:hypothetical protein
MRRLASLSGRHPLSPVVFDQEFKVRLDLRRQISFATADHRQQPRDEDADRGHNSSPSIRRITATVRMATELWHDFCCL